MADLVRYEIVDNVAVITIDNPPVNALSPAVWNGMDDAVARAHLEQLGKAPNSPEKKN